jgi:3alpha(or 20beta)-hydroxysteroid dehydrogenase
MTAQRAGRLAGRVIVVTGAARGQGAAEAEALACEGAHVIATDLTAPPFSGPICGTRLDVTSPADWAAVAAGAEERFGHVEGLINNAGIAARDRIDTVPLDEWNRALQVNVTGAMLGIQALLRLMGSGASIVNVGSAARLSGHYAVAYTASKWAIRGLTHACAMELGERGIRVNAVHPCFIETPMTDAAPAAFRSANLDVMPLGRVGMPQDVAQLMVFLMSDESSFITGVDLPIDGGYNTGGSAKCLSTAVRADTDPR